MIGAILLLAATALEPRVTMYPLPQSQIPTEIVRHGDRMWFVSWHVRPRRQAYFGQISMRGRIRTRSAPAGHMPGFTTRGPDGTLWLSDAGQPVLWRITLKGRIGNVKTRYWTVGIAYGPDGHLWCTHQSAQITRFGTDGSEQGAWSIPFDRPMTSSLPPPPGPDATWIVAGSDGALWFIDSYQRKVGRITTAGEITLFPAGVSQFNQLIAGPDGALWFTTVDEHLGRITTSGELTKVKIGFRAEPIASDSKGRIWYADANRAGYRDTDGSVHEFAVASAVDIRSMAEGPDGAMWFADQMANAIGRLELRPPSTRRR